MTLSGCASQVCGTVGEGSLLYECVFATLVDLRDPRSMCSCVEGKRSHIYCVTTGVSFCKEDPECVLPPSVWWCVAVCEGFLGSEWGLRLADCVTLCVFVSWCDQEGMRDPWVPAHVLLGGCLVAESREPAGLVSICLISECWRR